jgi:pimeloyl-ACP methyl ester carboxylesterase
MNDIEVPIKEVQEISKLIPKAYLEIFQATGHDIHIEKPKLLSAKIAQYVNNL